MAELGTETINRVLELAPAGTLDVDGYTYLDKDKTLTLHKPPVPIAITVSTLTGMVDLLEAEFEAAEPATCFFHVAAYDTVRYQLRESDRYGRRQTFIVSERIKPEQEFRFGVYQSQEQFVIALRSLFVQDANINELVALAGNLAAKAEVHQQDDGFTQQTTVKAGVHLVAEKVVKPMVDLRPYRTFLEVEQPVSTYVFRVKGGETGSSCALFEADGGTWKLTAMENVKTWLTNRLKGSEANGLADIPVVA